MDFKKITRLSKGKEARIKFKEGVDLAADFVRITLGPKGRNVFVNKIGPLPTRSYNDGVTIIREVKSKDVFIQAGVEAVQEICEKTNNNAGDGTSQTALLAQAITDEGQKRLITGFNPVDLKQELEEDSENLIAELLKMSNEVKTVDDVKHIATIAGNNDPKIGDAIAEILEKVGMSASIIIEKGNEEEIKTETVKGMYFEKGFRAPAFVNNSEKGVAEYKEPSIFIVDDSLRYDDDINEFFGKCVQGEHDGEENVIHDPVKDIIIIANEIEGEVLNTLCLTHKDKYTNPQSKINFNVLVIEAPFVGPGRDDFLSDLAVYTGATIIKKLDEAKPWEVAGSCDRLIANSKTTTIIGGKGKPKEIEDRIEEIKNLISQLGPTEKTIKANLEDRRDTIASGVGIIYGGGKTEIEIKERNLRLEDAVRASKAAIQEGFVAGGGFTYLMLSKLAKSDILQNALTRVVWQVAKNAGKSADSIVEKSLELDCGYNAKTDKFEDLIKAGVIDATLVLRQALQNSVSLAGSFLTGEGLIAEDEEAREFKFD